MTNFICVECGTQFAETIAPPSHCPICEDERQYVRPGGQQWTTLEELRNTHSNKFEGLPDRLGVERGRLNDRNLDPKAHHFCRECVRHGFQRAFGPLVKACGGVGHDRADAGQGQDMAVARDLLALGSK
jgi:hypothetical protein